MTFRATFRRAVTGATASVVASSSAAGLLRLLSSVTLTRLLDASAYGVVGVILSVAVVLTMLSDVGLHEFVLRHPRGDEARFLDELWTLRLFRNGALAVATFVVAHPVAWLLGKPELAAPIAVWGLSFVIESLGSLASTTAIREGQLWRLSLMDFCGNLATFLVSVAGALALHSYWALIVGMLCGAGARAIASYRVFPAAARRFAFDRERGRELWAFSRNIAGSSFLSLLVLQADKAVLARLMPLATFGLYAIATTLAASAGFLSGSFADRVLAGTYARAAREDRRRLRQIVYAARRRMAVTQLGSVGAMIGGAPLMIAILYDRRFGGVVPLFQWLAISAGLRILTSSANYALLAVGRTRPGLIASAVRVGWLCVAAAVGFATGRPLAMVALVGTIEAPVLLCHWAALRREGLLDLREEGLLLGVAVACVVAGHFASEVGLALLPMLRSALTLP